MVLVSRIGTLQNDVRVEAPARCLILVANKKARLFFLCVEREAGRVDDVDAFDIAAPVLPPSP